MKRRLAGLIPFLLTAATAHACAFCNDETKQAIFDSRFYPNLFLMLSAFIAVGLIVAVLTLLSSRKYQRRLAANPGLKMLTPVPLTTTSMILGIGLGGFIDGIVLHQVLQWHEMLSNKIPATTYLGKTVNMFWDGVFHAFCLVVVLIGATMLWKLLWRQDIDRSGTLFAGGMLAGWGIFNITEGIIDHHILKLHNVREISVNPGLWNFGFLALSVIIVFAGYILINRKRHAAVKIQ
jgi:uncharacterized membrane protein